MPTPKSRPVPSQREAVTASLNSGPSNPTYLTHCRIALLKCKPDHHCPQPHSSRQLLSSALGVNPQSSGSLSLPSCPASARPLHCDGSHHPGLALLRATDPQKLCPSVKIYRTGGRGHRCPCSDLSTRHAASSGGGFPGRWAPP